MSKINITINGGEYAVEQGITILEAARENGVHIPTLCHFEGIPGRANCRMCVVEVEGMRTFQPACVTRASEGMSVKTDTPRLRAARKATLELILAHHAVDCHHCLRIGSSTEQSLDPRFCEMCFWCDCVRDGFCELQVLAREYHVDMLPYIQHEADCEEDCSLGSIIRNPNKCIKCRRCVDICGEVQTVHNLSMANRGRDIMVVPELGKSMADSACVRCGHCVDVCPVGAIYMQEHIDEVLYMTHSYHVDTIAQLSPDVLPELAKLYKVPDVAITMEHVNAALHKIGFDTVVTDEQAKRLAAKQAEAIIDEYVGKRPVILTNSRAVLNFVERYFPEMKDQISVYESVQAIFGRSAREKENGRPLKTIQITAVKEAGAEARETGNVDYVLNARELYRMFLRTGGAPSKKTPMAFQETCWEPEKYPQLLGDKAWDLTHEPEEFALNIAGAERKCAVAHNLGQVRQLLEGSWKNYDIVRLLA